MPDSSPATVTEDEIQAAIAEIENMLPAELAAIPGLGGGSGDATGSPEQPSPNGPGPSNRSVAGAPTEHVVAPQAPVQHDGAVSGEGDSRGGRSEADRAGGIAELIKVWAYRFRAGLSYALARLRTVLGPKSADALPQGAPQQPAATEEEEQSASFADVLPAEGICRLVDQALDAVNAPFARFSGRVRRAIGLAAIVTVAISIAVQLVFPHVMPHRDAVSFLREKRAQLDAQATAPAPPDSPTGSNEPREL